MGTYNNVAKYNLQKTAKNRDYYCMEKSKADMTNFRRKPYSVGKGKVN